MQILPCPLCGYDAPGEGCPHCGRAPREPSLAPRPRGVSGLRAGFAAIPHGMEFLLSTRGVKRFLLPPIALTMVPFVAAFFWALHALQRLVELVKTGATSEVDIGIDWLSRAIRWILSTGAIAWLAHAAGFLVILVAGLFVALWTFSIVFEAFAGPFLDEIQGRIEKRWFGVDPVEVARPDFKVSTKRIAVLTSVAAACAIAAIWMWWRLSFPWSWVALLSGVLVPPLVIGMFDREYGRWLAWIVGREGSMLWTGIQASLLAGVLLVFCLPLKFVPLIGPLLFGMAAGFTTAVSLLDIPFSRRRWSLAMRFRFLRQNLAAVTTFGAMAGLVFLIPIIGLFAMVPAASIGGQWLVCRVDKSRLRK
jgi:uncharacterized protein involved in cysteine biosynthesis